jgi:hypothetical protein
MNVWAHRVGNFKPTGGGEWNETLKFNALGDLLKQFKNKNIAKGQVQKLGIVAHGDAGGLVQLDADLTLHTIGQFSEDLRALQDYLGINARVIFYSCIAAMGPEGSGLLNELSGKFFPGRHLIGFERYGLVPQEALQIPTGEVPCSTGRRGPQGSTADCDPSPTLGLVLDPRKKAEHLLSEYSIYAKWSHQGQVIKIPYSEIQQNVAPGPRVIYGGAALVKALLEGSTEIDYIAMKIAHNPTNEVQRLYLDVQRYGFRDGPPAYNVKELTSDVWKALPPHYGPAHSFEKEVIVAVYKKKSIPKYKCAWNLCPTHRNVQDICPQFANRFPNGPLS